MEKDHSQGDQSIFVIYVPVDNNFPTIFVDNNLQIFDDPNSISCRTSFMAEFRILVYCHGPNGIGITRSW